MDCILNGLHPKKAAEFLGLPYQTVKQRLTKIYAKYHIDGRWVKLNRLVYLLSVPELQMAAGGELSPVPKTHTVYYC